MMRIGIPIKVKIPKFPKIIWMSNKRCFKCKRGRFIETEFYNDLDGTITCNNCNFKVKLRQSVAELRNARGS